MELQRIVPSRDLEQLRSFLSSSDPQDYLLDDLPMWIQEGTLWAGLESGEWVAFGRVHDLGDRAAWVSGLRVRSVDRGRGLGGQFLSAVLAEARTTGLREFRAVIEATNDASRRLFASQGFRSVLEMTLRCGAAIPGDAPALRRARVGEVEVGAVGWIPSSSGRADLLPGTDGGRFGRWSPNLLERWTREGKLYLAPGLAVAVQVDWLRDPLTMWVNPLKGAPDALIPAVGRLARQLGQERWQSYLPSTEELRDEYRRLGLTPHPHWGDRVHLYERVEGGPDDERNTP